MHRGHTVLKEASNNDEIPAHSCNNDGATCIAGLGGPPKPVEQEAILTSSDIKGRMKLFYVDLGLEAVKLHGLHGDKNQLQIPSQAPSAVEILIRIRFNLVEVGRNTCVYIHGI